MSSERDAISSLMGRMLSMAEEHHVEMLRRSWFCQDRAEQKARLAAVIDLSVELARIRSIDIFATGLGEIAIMEVITGDWEALARWVDDFTFAHEGVECARRYGPLWAQFRLTLEAACASATARAGGVQPS